MLSNKSGESEIIQINSCINTFVTQNKRGSSIWYPDIVQNAKVFSDDVHLSKLGNSLFLNTIQGALYSFISTRACIYPKCDSC